MTATTSSRPTRNLRQLTRAAVGSLPRETRFALYRRMVECDSAPDNRLSLHVASTQPELEACFALLHDAYVASGFMRPSPSGLRVTPYHALPTTTTLCASFDGQVVGTLSIVREGVFGFPLQSAFDLSAVRALPGRIAEISALAIHPDFRNTSGAVLFPLMKFMYEYCTTYFDTRHLVIAVNPKHIDMYESLLLFRRLQTQVVESYDFVNGAPAVGATLDLATAPEVFQQVYEGRRPERNLHHYFAQVTLPNIRFPGRSYYTTNDPVMTPALLDHFFNRRTQVFAQLDERRRRLLHAIYPERSYAPILPPASTSGSAVAPLRCHRRLSLSCPAQFEMVGQEAAALEVIDVSMHGLLARSITPLPDGAHGLLRVRLGAEHVTTEDATVVRRSKSEVDQYYGFRIDSPNQPWRLCIAELDDRDAALASQGALAADETSEERFAESTSAD